MGDKRWARGAGRLVVLSNSTASVVTAHPGILEIESTSDAVYIHHFSGKVEAGADLALHGLEVNFFEFHTTGGDEFIFVDTLAVDW